MSLKPLPEALIIAAQMRRNAAEQIKLAEALEASVPPEHISQSTGVFLFGEIKRSKKHGRKNSTNC